MRTMLASTVAGLTVAFAAACSSDAPADCAPADSHGTGTTAQVATCANWTQRLIDCEVIAGSRLSGCEDDDPRLPCVWSCMQNATCKQIKASYCDDFLNGYAGCLNECHAIPRQFTCDDGSKISETEQCDGVKDCPNGEDEYCTQGYFACDDGLMIPESWQCDGLVSCAGGEDEAGCPPGPMFTCEDGQSIDASLECNGVENCAGGEDELDCARLTCE